MKKLIYIVLLSAIIVLGGSTASGQIAEIASPVHFNDTQWKIAGSSFNSIEIDVTPEVIDGNDGYYYSYASWFSNYTGNNTGALYMGLQTNGHNGVTGWIGNMAIFSVWDVGSGIVEPNGTGISFGGEGTGYSVRIPYPFQAGTAYRFRLFIDQDASSGNRLWAATIRNLSSGVTTRIGRIYAPVSYGKLIQPVSFHERYGAPNTPNMSCSDLDRSEVTFANATANNGTVKATASNTYLKADLGPCAALAWIESLKTPGSYRSVVGRVKPAPTKENTTPAKQAPNDSTAPKVAKPVPDSGDDASVETDTTQPSSPATTQNSTGETVLPASTPSRMIQWVLVVSFILFLVIYAFVFIFLKRRKTSDYLKKHFPYDFDLHGKSK